MSMSAHVTMRRQDRQDDTVHTQRRLTATLSPTNLRAESKGNRWHPRDVIVVCAVQARPSTESRALLTNQIWTWFISLSKDVVMSLCPSITQSERFLLTDQLITRLRRVEPATCCSHDGLHSHVVGKRDRERVQVRCSDLVGSDLPHTIKNAASVQVPGLCDEPLEVS